MTKYSNIDGKIGVEIECGLVTNYSESDFSKCLTEKHWRSGYDGSVHCRNAREIQSAPYLVRDLNNFFEDAKKVFSFIASSNSSCGLHIHISFANLKQYYLLFSYKFVQAFQNYIKQQFISVDERARLDNYYCKFYSNEQNFLNATKSQIADHYKSCESYHIINYNAFNLYHTVEFRVFPGVSSLSELKKYVNMLLAFVDKYLSVEYPSIEGESNDEITEQDESIELLDSYNLVDANDIELLDNVISKNEDIIQVETVDINNSNELIFVESLEVTK